MKNYIIYFFLVLSFSVFAQNTIDDELTKIVESKSNEYYQFEDTLEKYSKDKETIEVFLQKAKKANNLLAEIYAYNLLGSYYRNKSLFSNAIKNHKKALTLAKQIKNIKAEIHSLNMAGVAYRRQDKIPEAIDYHQTALQNATRILNPDSKIKRSISIAQNGLGNIYLSLKQYKIALSRFNNSIEHQAEIGNLLGLAINHQNIGFANEQLGNLNLALLNYKKSLDYNNQIKSNVGLIVCNNSISNILIKQQKYAEALKLIKPILPLAKKVNDQYYLTDTYITLGRAQRYNNLLVASEKNINEALVVSKEFNIQKNISSAYEELSELNKLKGNYKNALQLYKQSVNEEAKVFNERNLEFVTSLTLSLDNKIKTRELETIKEQNEIANLQVTRSRNILTITLVSLALLGVILFSIFRQRTLQNDKNVLNLKQQALQSQMNPHFVFNALNSIKLYIINNEQKNAVNYLNKFAKLIRKILEASKVKENSLREELETMDLYMTIENIRFSNEIDFTMTIDESINIDNIKVPPLVLQPFLENSLWHGLSSKKGVKKIDLRIIDNPEKNYIQIEIEDNGIGRKASAKIKANKSLNRKSIGIDLTKERLRSFVKDFEHDFTLRYFDLTNDQGEPSGTKVSIRLPLA